MSRSVETTIPLVLWLSTAAMLHITSYQGATTVADINTGKSELRGLLADVRQTLAPPREAFFEVSLPGDAPAEPPKEEPPKPPEEQPKPEKKAEKKAEKAPEEKKPEAPKEAPKKQISLDLPKVAPPPPPPPPPAPDKRVAVVQHVDDKKQEDNPEAKFVADDANKVKEEQQAKITAHDQNEKNPTAGVSRSAAGAKDEPGNADHNKVADSVDSPGRQKEPPGEASKQKDVKLPTREARPDAPRAAQEPKPAQAPPSEKAGENGRSGPKAPSNPTPVQPTAQPQPAPAPPTGGPEVQSSEGGQERVSPFRKPEPNARPDGSSAMLPKVPAVPTTQRPYSLPKLGGGSGPNGINFNLSPGGAIAAIGTETLKKDREEDGERRKSAHRGAWQPPSLERWKPAIENYVASVKPGNQTALNTARVPFATYLNHIHNRVHPIFAESFLDSLPDLPSGHFLNQPHLVTWLEIIVDGEHGRIVKMGVVKTSGVTAFDVAALDAMDRASGGASKGFGKPPPQIVSPDGRVYLHWEFHRDRNVACSTINARPFMINGGSSPGGAPPSSPPKIQVPDPREQGAPPPMPPSKEGRAPSSSKTG